MYAPAEHTLGRQHKYIEARHGYSIYHLGSFVCVGVMIYQISRAKWNEMEGWEGKDEPRSRGETCRACSFFTAQPCAAQEAAHPQIGRVPTSLLTNRLCCATRLCVAVCVRVGGLKKRDYKKKLLKKKKNHLFQGSAYYEPPWLQIFLNANH